MAKNNGSTPAERLSGQQEKFCIAIVDGMSQQDAYGHAYPKASASAARTMASRLLTNANIQARVSELRAEIAERAVIDKAEIVNFLASVIRTPISEIDATSPLCQEHTISEVDGRRTERLRTVPKIQAVERLCKMCGWDQPDKVDVEQRVHGSGLRLRLSKEDEAFLNERAAIIEKIHAQSGHKQTCSNGVADHVRNGSDLPNRRC